MRFDQIWIVDDGSPVMPAWDDIEFISADALAEPSKKVSLHHFDNRLGKHRKPLPPFPGWYRSFAYAVNVGIARQFDRIIHIEADAFLISQRAHRYFNERNAGWTALWCPLYRWPESTLQIIASDAYDAAHDFFSQPYAVHCSTGAAIESLLPFTHVEKGLIGDRYGEFMDRVPYAADYVSQIAWGKPRQYYWWLDNTGATRTIKGEFTMADIDSDYRGNQAPRQHEGLDYRQFLRFLDQEMQPRSYLEIGTHRGDSAACMSCPSICVDPNFMITTNVIGKKPASLFFQTGSDNFFADYDAKSFFGRIDLAFLDGLHHYEALLRDLINFERHAHKRSLALMHDCLPLNTRMTSRAQSTGTEDEDEAVRGFWTGDVWKVIPILNKLRPDLDIVFLDCPPTGLVLCRGLDPDCPLNWADYAPLVKEYETVSLEDFGFDRLWSLYPMASSRKISQEPMTFFQTFDLRG